MEIVAISNTIEVGKGVNVPNVLTYVLVTHSTMMQVSGEGELLETKMKAVASALVSGTSHESAINIDYLWRKTWLHYPEIMNLVKAKNHNAWRAD